MATEEKSRKRRSQDAGGAAPKKRQRRRRAPREEDGGDDDADIDVAAGVNRAFERMDGQLLADRLAQKTRRFGTDLSQIELSDLYVPAGAVRDTGSWLKPRTRENLPEFLEAFVEDPEQLASAAEEKGAPHTIVVTGAGLRAAELVRSLRKFQKKEMPVAKLFAKHIKLEEAVSFLSQARTGIAVGTPVRLIDLLDNGALSVKHLKRVVVDASHVDQKKRGVMDSKDTMIPLARWLSRAEFKERYSDPDSPVDLMFY